MMSLNLRLKEDALCLLFIKVHGRLDFDIIDIDVADVFGKFVIDSVMRLVTHRQWKWKLHSDAKRGYEHQYAMEWFCLPC